MRNIFVVILLVLVSGCTKYWYNPSRTFEQCEYDRLQCFKQLGKLSDLNSSTNYKLEYMKECMKDKGYKLVGENKLPLDVKRQAPDNTIHWQLKGISGRLY
jgi:hypothetical protein